jgi:drug/metabolite transporter (DMT)-like permease
VAIVCFLILGERLGKLEILSIFSAMFGVVLLTRPELIFPSLANQTLNELANIETETDLGT